MIEDPSRDARPWEVRLPLECGLGQSVSVNGFIPFGDAALGVVKKNSVPRRNRVLLICGFVLSVRTRAFYRFVILRGKK